MLVVVLLASLLFVRSCRLRLVGGDLVVLVVCAFCLCLRVIVGDVVVVLVVCIVSARCCCCCWWSRCRFCCLRGVGVFVVVGGLVVGALVVWVWLFLCVAVGGGHPLVVLGICVLLLFVYCWWRS